MKMTVKESIPMSYSSITEQPRDTFTDMRIKLVPAIHPMSTKATSLVKLSKIKTRTFDTMQFQLLIMRCH